ncbi:cytochrome c maturation protein CcmE [Roseisolibacter sp. H3M3-2]|uniref:cytochrome c maturation protein CcmE n=1 Tax=Roseisolibacter sp. H3M3-2 TaxID=3031323 RepID=UPI0023DB1B10|nr:cytochrome c maturation protein CcmE [Roseisolibacter sp. H3M3-2]MDF1503205.1 cytochrome c maturation protein CcmE [Roseisolibacter sp. H3M3-2]
MKARNKFLIGGALVLGSASYLMASSIQDTGQYFLTPTELQAKVADDPSFVNQGVKIGAKAVPGTIVRDPSGRSLRFVMADMADSTKTYPVYYKGIAPDTFTDGVEVVVEGRLQADGTFHATTLLAKCASRYENAPEQGEGTPGYKEYQQYKGKHPAGVPKTAAPAPASQS